MTRPLSPRAMRRVAGAAAVALVLLPSLVAAWLIFPTMDDAWLFLLVRESGLPAISASLKHRPLFGLLLTYTDASPDAYLILGIAITAATWAVMAAETAWLWRWLFPEERRFAPLAACLAVAPIVTTTQWTTLTVVLPVTVPAVCGIGALLLAIRHVDERRPGALWTGAALVFGAGLVSEYVLAPLLGAIVLLAWVYLTAVDRARQRRTVVAAAVLVLAFVASHAVFRATADFVTRPDATMGSLASRMATQEVLDLPWQLAYAVWRAIAGAYLAAFSGVRVSFFERSTLLAGAWGLGVAAALWASRRRVEGATDAVVPDGRRGRLWATLVAVAAILSIETVFGGVFFPEHPGVAEPLSTRFYIPSLPLAACVTTACLFAVRTPLRPVLAGIAGWMIGYCAVVEPYAYVRVQPVMAILGEQLKPVVQATPDLTVAVTTPYLGRDYEVTYKATLGWPTDLSRRLWITWEGRLRTFGYDANADRAAVCRDSRRVDAVVTGIRRAGVIQSLLWIPDDRPGPIVENYCGAE